MPVIKVMRENYHAFFNKQKNFLRDRYTTFTYDHCFISVKKFLRYCFLFRIVYISEAKVNDQKANLIALVFY